MRCALRLSTESQQNVHGAASLVEGN